MHQVSHQALGKTLFPVGDVAKNVVRQIASDAGFDNARKKDSTGICFIGERRFSDFLQQYLPAQPGDIRSWDGDVIGQHQGLMYHTIGQRQGLGIGGLADRDESPWYVVDKALSDNTLVVAQGNDHPALYKNNLVATGIIWISGEAPTFPLDCQAKIRYRQADQTCTVTTEGERTQVSFAEAQRAVTPGQSVVFYQGRRVPRGWRHRDRRMNERPLIEQRTLALAGVAQAARIVDLAAKTGSWPEPFVEASIHSLFCFEPEAVEAVFGTPQGIRLGLEQLSACLRMNQDPAAADTLRYTMAMLHLERRFAARDDMQSIIHSRLKHTAYKAENFSNDIRGLSANISAIYQDTLSNLPYRIKVTGSAQHLNNPQVADLVRSVLLCGVRAAFLWRQLGGNRLKLMWHRGTIRDTAARLALELGVSH